MVDPRLASVCLAGLLAVGAAAGGGLGADCGTGECDLDPGSLLQVERSKRLAPALGESNVSYPSPARVGWNKSSEPLDDAEQVTVDFAFSCSQAGRAILEKEVLQRADPTNLRYYGRWLTAAAIERICDYQGADVVKGWLQDQGFEEAKHFSSISGGRLVRATMSHGQARKLFRTEFSRYRVGNASAVLASDFEVPRKVHEAVSALYGLHDIPYPLTRGSLSEGSESEVGEAGPLGIFNVLPEEVLNQWRKLQRLGGVDNQPGITLPTTGHPSFLGTPDFIRRLYGVPETTGNGAAIKLQEANLAAASKDMERAYIPGEDKADDPDMAPLPAEVTQSVFETVNGFSVPLAQYYSSFFNLPNTSIDVVDFDVPHPVSTVASEANLDIQMITALAPEVPLRVYSVPPLVGGFFSAIKVYTTALLDLRDPPLVNSMSYGLMVNRQSASLSGNQQLEDLNTDFLLLAARGLTVLVASQDNGAGYNIPYVNNDAPKRLEGQTISGEYYAFVDLPTWQACAEECQSLAGGQMTFLCAAWSFPSPLGSGCGLFYQGFPFQVLPSVNASAGGPNVIDGQMTTSFPASSPWVTAVGATTVHQNGADPSKYKPEMAANSFGSGGGFTTYPVAGYGQQPWQAQAVRAFLATPLAPSAPKPSPNGFDPRGRALPDIAALGQNNAVATSIEPNGPPPFGCCFAQAGTSAATPVLAGIVSRLNVARHARGLPPMGFLNPWLYHYKPTDDVVVGANNIPRSFTWGPAVKFGFPAAPGWDPVTGLGTPNFEKMLPCAFAPYSFASRRFCLHKTSQP